MRITFFQHSLLVEADSPDDDLSNRVGVTVAGRSPVLQISVSLLRHVPGDPDAAAPVGHPALKSWMLEVSCSPVSLLSLSLPLLGSYAMMCLLWCLERLSMAASMTFIPPGFLMSSVEKLQ